MFSASPTRGRWAPSPTGRLHVGSARTALAAWLSARSGGGSFVYRLEDLDPPRVVPGAAEALAADLAWLGIDWDEGPDVGGPHAPYVQSARGAFYEEALARLAESERLFPCRVSRAELARVASAPHGEDGLPPYPRELAPRHLPAGWYGAGAGDAALRFRVGEEPVRFADRVFGEIEEWVAETVGDFVLKRRDGFYAYQLAVVVDDLAMGIDEVVRGADLLSSTARQIELIRALGGEPPAYAHVPLVVNAAGEKLSKRDGGLALAALRERGVSPEAVTGYLAFSLGLLPEPEPCRPAELVGTFSWEKVGRETWRLPRDLAGSLAIP